MRRSVLEIHDPIDMDEIADVLKERHDFGVGDPERGGIDERDCSIDHRLYAGI